MCMDNENIQSSTYVPIKERDFQHQRHSSPSYKQLLDDKIQYSWRHEKVDIYMLLVGMWTAAFFLIGNTPICIKILKNLYRLFS